MPIPAGNSKKYKAVSLSYKSPQSQDGFSFLPNPQIEPQVLGGWSEVEWIPKEVGNGDIEKHFIFLNFNFLNAK